MSTLMYAQIVNVIVLAAVLEADLGPHRKITRFRLLRPVLITAAVVPMFLEKVATHGDGLSLELALAAAGIVLGLVATALMTVYRSPKTGKPVSRAGSATPPCGPSSSAPGPRSPTARPTGSARSSATG